MLWWPAVKTRSTAMTQRPRDRVPSGSLQALPDPRRPDRANPPTNFGWSFFDNTGMIYMHWIPAGQRVNKEYYVEVLKESRKRFRRNGLALFKSGQWHFQQDNAPVHNSILVTDYLTKMGLKTVYHPPYNPDLSPCDLSLWDNWDERGCDERDWHTYTRGLPWGLPEVVGTVQVHCSRRRLLRKGLEFHVCTINKSAYTQKVWKLIEGIVWVSYFMFNINFSLSRFSLKQLFQIWVILQPLSVGRRTGFIFSAPTFFNLDLTHI